MAYASRYGRRPMENASRSSHTYVINDAAVQGFLDQCVLPPAAERVDIPADRIVACQPEESPIRHFVAIDGGYQVVPVRADYPSAEVCFLQFGALIFGAEDLENLAHQPFIDPADMAKLKQIQRFKLVLPVRNVSLSSESSFTASVRQALYRFFRDTEDPSLLDTLAWLIFRDFRHGTPPVWDLASCPECGQGTISLRKSKMSADYTFQCPECGGTILLTDVLRLHEAIDEEMGAGGILGYVTTAVEQLILVHVIRTILNTKPDLLRHLLFIKDGPLAFFGQTANMHKPMRALVRYLLKKHDLFLAGLEKSGAFVEHADEIASRLDPGTAILLDSDYIYRYILPRGTNAQGAYGRTTYYGAKLIHKTHSGDMHVVTLPTGKPLEQPLAADLPHLNVILDNIERLHCDMYDNALIPVALANKLVSLANHPSAHILEKFAKESIQS